MQSGISRQLATRVLLVVPVVFGVVTLTFLVSRVFAPDPVALYVPPQADEQLRQEIRARLGLDKSIPEQYAVFLGDLTQGDLGESTITGRPVTSDLWDRLPATFELALFSLTFAIVVGIPLGVIAGARRDGPLDFSVRGITLVGMALPSFWLGLVLILVFFVILGWFPGPVGRLPLGATAPEKITGLYTLDSLLAGDWAMGWESFRHLVLPGVTLGVVVMAPITRVARASMVEVMRSEYIRTPKALGIRKQVIYFRYALKNALLPIVTMIGVIVGFVFTGAVLVESVFNWPGMGKYGLDAIIKSDFTALQGFVLIASITYIVAFFLVDVVYMLIDPRTR
ncbi:MAG: ABC transporter permease [bacterium]|nr:ABC transporter permease [bacterium]